jgi:hypothetical protein
MGLAKGDLKPRHHKALLKTKPRSRAAESDRND